jgi:hypothetical protein
MASSKFVEILDTNDAPYSRENVSLEDVLGDERHRKRTSSTDSSSTNSPTSEQSPIRDTTQSTTANVKSRIRGFSLMKGKS